MKSKHQTILRVRRRRLGAAVILAFATTLAGSPLAATASAPASASVSAAPRAAATTTGVVAGGMAIVNRTWPATPGGLSDIETSITISTEPGANGYTYWAHQWGYAAGEGGYVGLQQRTGTEKALNFSIWGATGWRDGAAGTYCRNFSHEGSGVQCDVTYDWRQGVTYTISVEKVANASWRATITDTSTKISTAVATIVLPSDRGGITTLSEWVENFAQGANTYASCAQVPKAVAVYGKPRGNKGTVTPVSSSSYAYGNCASIARTTCTSDQACSLIVNPDATPTTGARLKNSAQGFCLDIFSGGNTAGLWNCDSGTSRNQVVHQDSSDRLVLSERSNECVTVRTDSTVGSATCDSSARQKWQYVSSTKAYKNTGTELCLEGLGGGAHGSALRVHTCVGSSVQSWTAAPRITATPTPTPTPTPPPTSTPQPTSTPTPAAGPRLKNVMQGRCVEISGIIAYLTDCTGPSRDQVVRQDSSGRLVLSERSNECLTVGANSSVQSTTCASSASQKWEYVSSTKAYKNVGTGQCLGAYGTSGITVQLCLGGAGQSWTVLG